MSAINVTTFCDCYKYPSFPLPEVGEDEPPYMICYYCKRIAYNIYMDFKLKN